MIGGNGSDYLLAGEYAFDVVDMEDANHSWLGQYSPNGSESCVLVAGSLVVKTPIFDLFDPDLKLPLLARAEQGDDDQQPESPQDAITRKWKNLFSTLEQYYDYDNNWIPSAIDDSYGLGEETHEDEDVLLGSNAPDVIFGSQGRDIIAGNLQSDIVRGGGGDDTIFAGCIPQEWVVDASHIPVDGTKDDSGNVIIGDGGSDTIYGSDHNDITFADTARWNQDANVHWSDYLDVLYGLALGRITSKLPKFIRLPERIESLPFLQRTVATRDYLAQIAAEGVLSNSQKNVLDTAVGILSSKLSSWLLTATDYFKNAPLGAQLATQICDSATDITAFATYGLYTSSEDDLPDVIMGGNGTDIIGGGRGYGDILLGQAGDDFIVGDSLEGSGDLSSWRNLLSSPWIPALAAGAMFIPGVNLIAAGVTLATATAWYTAGSAVADAAMITYMLSQQGSGAIEFADAGGTDFIYGGLGNDRLVGGGANDIIYAGGFNRVDSTTTNDTLLGGEGVDYLYNYALTGALSISALRRSGTRQLLDSDKQVATIYGDEGGDHIRSGVGGAVIYADGVEETLTTENDASESSDGPIAARAFLQNAANPRASEDCDDTIEVLGGDNRIVGGPGNDVINTGKGNDFIVADVADPDFYKSWGEIGDIDSLFSNPAPIYVNDYFGERDAATPTIDKVFDSGGKNYVLLGSGDDEYTAIDPGNHGWNVVSGGDGVDRIAGAGKYSILIGGDGDDTLTGGEGRNLIVGDDVTTIPLIDAYPRNVTIDVGDIFSADAIDLSPVGWVNFNRGVGNDTITGGPRMDLVIGGDGEDTIKASPHDPSTKKSDFNVIFGDDVNYPRAGRGAWVIPSSIKTFFDRDRRDLLDRRSDNSTSDGAGDLIRGGYSNVVFGDEGNDVIIGGPSFDFLVGDDGDDKLYGREGVDWLEGGEDSDLLVDPSNGSFLWGEPQGRWDSWLHWNDADEFYFNIPSAFSLPSAGAHRFTDYDGGVQDRKLSTEPAVPVFPPSPLFLDATSSVAPSHLDQRWLLGDATNLNLLQDVGEYAVEALVLTAFDRVQLDTADLSGDLLGEASGDAITLDVDAAGYGWFIDATPWESSEFDAKGAAIDEQAKGRVDLLSVVIHELGHIQGLGHSDDPDDFMFETLPPGTRRVSALLNDVFYEELRLADDEEEEGELDCRLDDSLLELLAGGDRR